MSVWRRPTIWRLAATLAVVLLVAVPGAFAQTQTPRQTTQKLQVKLGPANVYERPRTSSDVFMVAQEGTILDVLGREGSWYWVLLPADGNGLRRGGYIATYLVDLINPKGPDVMPRTGVPAIAGRPPDLKARPTGAGRNRYFAGLGGGGQSASMALGDSVNFLLYDDDGSFSARYQTQKASAVDATFGLRLSPHWVLAVAYWHATSVARTDIAAIVPSQLWYQADRLTSATGVPAARSENQGHLQMTFVMPLSERVDLSVFGGPSLFYLRQDLIGELGFNEYPGDNVSISNFYRQTHSRATIGANAGVDVTVMVWRYFGVGLAGRYARGSMTLNSADGNGEVKVRLGGAQVSGGLRMRF